MTTTESKSDGKGLATGQLGLIGSTVMGLASTAPVYSLVATLGFVVAVVGFQTPIAFILAFIPMFFIAFAYRELNRAVPDCGTTFTWATKAFGPWVGWLGGWGVAVAGIIVLANLAQIAGIYFWLLIGQQELSENTLVTTITGVVFIAAMVYVSYRGVEIGEKLQNVLLGVQYLALALFVIFALGSVFGPNPPSTGSTRQASLRSTASPRPCCWRCSSTGAGTPAWRSTRRPRTRSGSRAAPRSSARSS